MADEGYSAMGGTPVTGGSVLTPEEFDAFQKAYWAKQNEAAGVTEVPKNIPAPPAYAPAVTPGPEAFKQHPTAGGGDLTDMDMSGDAANRAVYGALGQVLGLGKAGLFTARQIATAGGYAPNEFGDKIRSAEDATVAASDKLARAQEEASHRAGYAPEKVQLLHPSTWSNADPWATGGEFFSPAIGVPGGILSKYFGKAGRYLGGAAGEIMGHGGGYGLAAGLANPITEGQVLGPNATPEERAQADSDFARRKLLGMTASTAGGMVLAPVAKEVAKVASGYTGPMVDLMLESGAGPTFAQTIGGDPTSSLAGKIINSIEQNSAKLPVVGTGIKNAFARVEENLNKAWGRRILGQMDESLPRDIEAGQPLNVHLHDKLQEAYNDVLPRTKARLDPQYDAALINVGQNENTRLLSAAGKAPEMKVIVDYIDRMQHTGLGAPGEIPGNAVKDIQSNLAKWRGEYSSERGPENQRMARFVDDVRDAFMGAVRRHTPKDALTRLNKVDSAYATYAQFRQATSRLGAEAGVANKNQFSNAVWTGDKSVGKGAYSRGQAYNQDLSDAAKAVLRGMPSSGTGEGTMNLELVKAIRAGMINPGDVAGTLATLGMYSRPGQALLRGVATFRFGLNTPIRKAVEQTGNAAVLAAQGQHGDEAAQELIHGPSTAVKTFGDAANVDEAAKNYFTAGKDVPGAQKALSEMRPGERDAFSNAYAKQWVDHVMNAPDPRTAINAWDTPLARKHMEAALGVNRARQLESVVRLENLQALSPWMKDEGFAKKLGAPGAIRTDDEHIAHAIKSGAALIGKKFSDDSVLRASALLASHDPQQYAKGIQQFSNSPMMDALRAYDKSLTAKGLTLKRPMKAGEAGAAPTPVAQQPVQAGAVGTVPAGAVAPYPRREQGVTPMQSTPPTKPDQLPTTPPPEPGAIPYNGGWIRKVIGNDGRVQYQKYVGD